ncbi:MAG: hypothetical protein ACTMIR_15915 [Cellulomonadaceae bacterium]
MKTYRKHYCQARHRTFRTLAKCVFSRAVWVTGNGPFAVVAWCGDLTVSLHPDVDTARSSKEFIDGHGCGGRCRRDHEIVLLEAVTS